jgi:hypothetical protein
MEGREAYLLFEEIVGFIDAPSKGGACIDILKIKTQENTFISGYSYLDEHEESMILRATSGVFSFHIDDFIKNGFYNTSADCRLNAYLRYRIFDVLQVASN